VKLNAAQQQAIAARGNVLVVAGAGTGKTRTLVERCLHSLLAERPRASINEMLLVTFTEAAAAEMRQRIRERLEEELKRSPEDTHCQEQLALFETAHVGTLHSFCLELARQHFYKIEIDPQVTVMREEESHALAEEQLDKLFQECYSGRHENARAVQSLIQDYGGGLDQRIRRLARRVHDYSQTLRNPRAWYEQQQTHFTAAEPLAWREWLREALMKWSEEWLPLLQRLAPANEIAQRCLAAAKEFPKTGDYSPVAVAVTMKKVIAACAECPRGKKGEWLHPLSKFLKEAEFLSSLVEPGEADPLQQDWDWTREPMGTVLGLAIDFGTRFAEAKREAGLVDFHDLEQFALRLLWDNEKDAPTEIAEHWRQTFRYVFVDEYQDINEAQDRIIQALSRDEPASANRFLVGDVKQSIYRFRLANPKIFQNYAREWRKGQGQVIPLSENFRSRERLLDFINSVFSNVMHEALGGVAYDEQARLRFGAAESRRALSAVGENAGPRVELYLRLRGARARPDAEEEEEEIAELPEEISQLEEPDKEARLIALRLQALHHEGHAVWDETQFRPMRWSDVAILLRAPAGKAESYAKEFSKLAIPLEVARLGFYQTREISDLLCLLQILDNPLQDLPVLAVLHSPLAGLTLDELATIRLARRGRFWSALIAWRELQANSRQANDPRTRELAARVSRFLDSYAHWRRLARQLSLSKCLETVLAESHYGSWVLAQRGGEQAYANVQQLLRLAQQFDRFQRRGLFRFLEFTKSQQEAEADPGVAALGHNNAVRLMSIHQSKGLEFPIVVVADLGKSFNVSDLNGEVMLDEEYGLCSQIKPPHAGTRFPSLAFWLARKRQMRELLGEELRLLYVAMTRAQDTLLLSATMAENRFAKMFKRSDALTPANIADARSYADWLGLWFAHLTVGHGRSGSERIETLLNWFVTDDRALIGDEAQTEIAPKPVTPFYQTNPAAWLEVQNRIGRKYPYAEAATRPAKTTVSAISHRRRSLQDTESEPLFRPSTSQGSATEQRPRHISSFLSKRIRAAAESGSVHHTFLQLVDLNETGSLKQLKAESQRLAALGHITGEEAEDLDLEAIATFWSSPLGQKIRTEASFIRRELPFTARFYESELAAITGETIGSELAKEFVVVQGIADLLVLLPGEIWLLDFKTDAVSGSALAARAQAYEPQLRIYAAALSRIHQRPVTRAWLYFLKAGTEAEIDCSPSPRSSPAAASKLGFARRNSP
jgi:ATP-dependent helicase/nuclease subunit A